MSFRKEKKYKLTIYDFNIIKDSLIKKGMEMLYQPRQINSLYYDTEPKDMFHNSEEGVLPRKKVRIRWYKDTNEASHEIKTSSIEGRFKITNAIGYDSLENFPKVLIDQLYGILTPSLLISYKREYYSFCDMRITFDTSITYLNYRLPVQSIFEDPERVMEIKVTIDTEDDFIEKIIPYATSRFSKYSRGLLFSQQELR
jgi:hypothetical protein